MFVELNIKMKEYKQRNENKNSYPVLLQFGQNACAMLGSVLSHYALGTAWSMMGKMVLGSQNNVL